jgi:hypothetical protein
MNLNREIAAERNFVDRYDAERAERERVRSRHLKPSFNVRYDQKWKKRSKTKS